MTHIPSSYDFNTYLSPLTWRYGSKSMRALWSEVSRRKLWRRVWVALADAQSRVGLVQASQVEALRAAQDMIDLDRAHAIEAETQHDLMAELLTFAEQAPEAASILHLGATSMDIEDNAEVLRIRDALDALCDSLRALLKILGAQIERLAAVPTMAFTHLQPAEPTTMGYRLSQYAQDLLVDLEDLQSLRAGLRGKGMKGAVGTLASYAELLDGSPTTAAQLEADVMQLLGLEAWPVSTQTYPRKQDWRVVNGLASLGQSLYRFAFDLRILQNPTLGEWSEPFGAKQVGSSAMPFKRNPITAERLNSLARQLASLPRVAWDNAAHSLLERTLDDSANRRALLPESFLLADELLKLATRLIKGLHIDEHASARLMSTYGPLCRDRARDDGRHQSRRLPPSTTRSHPPPRTRRLGHCALRRLIP